MTIPLQDSVKAIAMIYAALGVARGAVGKTMTQLVNGLGSASSDTASNIENTSLNRTAGLAV